MPTARERVAPLLVDDGDEEDINAMLDLATIARLDVVDRLREMAEKASALDMVFLMKIADELEAEIRKAGSE